MSQPKSDHDPLLEFSIEPGAAPMALPPPSQPVEPIAAPAVAAASTVRTPSSDEVDLLRARIDRLEKSVNQSAKELQALNAKRATKVSATADNRKWVAALAGVIVGIAASVWFFLSSGGEPLVPASPVAQVEEPPPPPTPPIVAPVSQPAIVQAAAITPVRETPVRETPVRVATMRETPTRASRASEYVGTLSIDSDPPANVLVDRQPAGRTPLKIADLKAGSHLIWIEKDGFQRFTRVVQVPADRVSRVVATLEPVAPR